MHPAFSTRGAQRRRFVSNTLRTREPTCVLQLTVDAGAFTTLREMVVRVCGAAFEYMRAMPPREDGTVKLWLCLRPAAVAAVAEAVRLSFPAAEVRQVFDRTGEVAQ